MSREFYAYILTNRTHTLYVGVTSDLYHRVEEHRNGTGGAFTSKYKITRLVYFEQFDSPSEAIAREKEIKGWLRRKKIALIEAENPKWSDLSREWFDDDS
ncbi:MAG TPA: GIY-YIG nuclease family protein [Candidatus Binataceae bacterium]|nr:GIY-YIG nuclease family protein [Candidatus Binataceae bacterium]